jgi:hypothetical protein
VDVADDHLESALVELYFATDLDKVSCLDVCYLLFCDIPHSSTYGARPVAELDEQVKSSIAIGTQLLVSQQIGLFESFSIRQLIDESTYHDLSEVDEGVAKVRKMTQPDSDRRDYVLLAR